MKAKSNPELIMHESSTPNSLIPVYSEPWAHSQTGIVDVVGRTWDCCLTTGPTHQALGSVVENKKIRPTIT